MAMGDEYYGMPGSFSGGVNKEIQSGMGMLGPAAMQRQQMQAQQQSMDEANSPMTPEQEAIMALTAEDADIKSVAAQYRARKGGGMQGAPGQQGGMSMTAPGGGAMNMPRPMTTEPNMEQPGQASPMTNRRYQDFMKHAGPIAAEKRGAAKSERIAEIGAEGKTRAAEIKSNLDWAKLDEVQKAGEFKRLIEDKKLSSKEAQEAAKIELGYARIEASINRFRSAGSNKERLEILDDMDSEVRSLESSMAEMTKNPLTLLANKALRERYDELKRQLVALKEFRTQYRQSIMDNPSPGSTTTEKESVKGPAGNLPQMPGVTVTREGQASNTPVKPKAPVTVKTQKKFKVGDEVTHKGIKKKVTQVSPEGKVVATNPPL